jgi:hypothetical protein
VTAFARYPTHDDPALLELLVVPMLRRRADRMQRAGDLAQAAQLQSDIAHYTAVIEAAAAAERARVARRARERRKPIWTRVRDAYREAVTEALRDIERQALQITPRQDAGSDMEERPPADT